LSVDNSPSPLINSHLSVDIVTTTEGFEAIHGQWDVLFQSANEAKVFQSFTWNYAWWKAFGLGCDLAIIIVREKDRIMGLAPFMVRHRLGVPQVEPIGSDQYAYFGVLIEGDRQDVIQAIGDCLNHTYPSGLIHFPYYNVADSSVNILGATLAAAGWREARWQRNIARCVLADSNYETYMMTKSQKVRYNLRREQRKLEEQHQMDVAHFFGSDIDDRVILRMANIQKRSWLSRRGADTVDAGALNVMIRALGREGMAEVFILTLSELDVAFILNFCSARCAHCISIAFDETFLSLSPGKVLMSICIKTLLDRGINAYDFLFGDGEYKRFWANRTILVFRSVCYRGLRSWVLSWIPHRLSGKLARYDLLRDFLGKARSVRKKFLAKKDRMISPGSQK